MAKLLVACLVALSILGAATLAVGSFFNNHESERVDCNSFRFEREAWLAPSANDLRGESITPRELQADGLFGAATSKA